MKDLQAIRGAELLRHMVAEGDHERQDFKYTISDARKIARSLSAFANHSGGRLLIGVKDNGVIAGVRNEEDIYVVEQAAERYCRPSVPIAFKAYRVDGTIRVIVAEIEPSPVRPVTVAEADGSLKAYYRVADENIAAHPLMVRAWQAASGAEPLGSGHYAMAAMFAAPGTRMDVRELALALHVSIGRVEDMVVALAAAGLLRFVYDGGRFLIEGAEPDVAI